MILLSIYKSFFLGVYIVCGLLLLIMMRQIVSYLIAVITCIVLVEDISSVRSSSRESESERGNLAVPKIRILPLNN